MTMPPTRLRLQWLYFVASFTLAAVPLRAEEGAVPQKPPESAFPQNPEFKFGPPASADVSERRKQAIEASSKQTAALEKVRQLLLAANLILAYDIEPACSSRVIGGVADAASVDADEIRKSLAQAADLIQSARGALSAELERTKAVDPATPRESEASADAQMLRHTSDAMQSFLDSQRAFLFPDEDSGARRRAASALAPLLEDPDRKVAAAARLWQALLRSSETDPQAALHILDSSAVPPSADAWPFGVVARVFKCRLQGARGSWSTALVQLIEMEEQLESWVPELTKRGDARRLFAMARLEVLRRWYDSLDPSLATERAWCVRQAESVINAYFSVESTLLRLEPAIPEFNLTAPRPGEPEVEPR